MQRLDDQVKSNEKQITEVNLIKEKFIKIRFFFYYLV